MLRIHSKSQFASLTYNSQLLIEELLQRNIELWLIDEYHSVVLASLGNHVEYFFDIQCSQTPFSGFLIAGNKGYAKESLSYANLPVPEGRVFTYDDIPNANIYAQQLGFPVVVKPTCGTHGDGVRTDLRSRDEVNQAILSNWRDFPQYDAYIVERYMMGQEYRVFVTRNGEFAVIHREPAFVIGDGQSNIETLAITESYKRRPPRTNCLCEIVIDDDVVRYLSRRDRSVHDVPEAGEKVTLRDVSNLKKGGMATDVTDNVHSSVIEICLQALRTLSLPYAGVDFITEDITQPQKLGSHAIIEINADAGIGMHVNPGQGKQRLIQKMIVDIAFPETISHP